MPILELVDAPDNGGPSTDSGKKQQASKARKVSMEGPPVDMNQEKQNILRCIKTHLFGVVKFVDSDADMQSTGKGSIARFMAKKLHLNREAISLRGWWSQWWKFVKQELNNQRSTCTTAMRKTYICKFKMTFFLFF